MIRTKLATLHALKEARQNKRITFGQAADDIGITRQTFAAWYHNSVETYYPNMITAFCRYYECEVGDLLEFVESGEVNV